MKCYFALITLLFSFHVIGGGTFGGHFIEKMCQFPFVIQNRLKGIFQP